MTYPSRYLQAYVADVADTNRVERLVIVADDTVGEVRVRWVLDRPQLYRCSECGPMADASCDHTFAAALALAEQLLGLTRTPSERTGALA